MSTTPPNEANAHSDPPADGICATVASLATPIAVARQPTGARERILIEILQRMPLYHEMGWLPPWEVAFDATFERVGRGPGAQDSEELNALLEVVYVLGCTNMYVGFSTKRVVKAYKRALKLFKEHGVAYPSARPILGHW